MQREFRIERVAFNRVALGRAVAAALLLLAAGATAVAELANVVLKDGTRLRGDVTTTDTEIVVSNQAGAVRYKKGEVSSVEWSRAPASLDEEYLRRVQVLTPDDLDGHFSIAEWAREKERFDLVRKQCTYILGLQPTHANARLLLEVAQRALAEGENRDDQPPRRPEARPRAGDGLAAPELLSEIDIRRLKMLEFPLQDAPKNLRVRFVTKRGEPDVIDLVKHELEAAGPLEGGMRARLERGKPAEQLAAVVEATGGKFADRVEIAGDPPVFSTFRRKVLPLVTKGCATSGCHGGDGAAVFRFPGGAASSEEHAYTTFLLLDQMPTHFGPLIDRKNPQQSPLITFLLARDATDRPHPNVPGEKVTPRLRGPRDPNHEMMLEWIESLRSPHPDYLLDYAPPDWLADLHLRMKPLVEEPPASQPSSGPTDGGG